MTDHDDAPPIDPRYAMTCAEIARELGARETTVYMQIQAAMAKFRRAWIRMYGIDSWREIEEWWRD